MSERRESFSGEPTPDSESVPEGEVVDITPPIHELNVKETTEHYTAERKCPDCKKDFTTSVLKNRYSRNKARQFFKDNPVCGACTNADKIKEAADYMNLMRDVPEDKKEAS